MEDKELMLEKAKWCLGCKGKPCANKGCPVKTPIPEFIGKIKEDKMSEAYDLLHSNNIFSYICGTICPSEDQCQGSCVRGIKQVPTEITRLERYVNDWAKENNYTLKDEFKPGEANGKKIAIIGSGPAGLECAYELTKNGYKTTVFEKDEKLGGILTYGIPDFRCEKSIIAGILENLKGMGIEFKTNTKLGEDITIEQLKNDYDAIFLGIGAEKSSVYPIGDFDGIYDSDQVLRAYNNGEFIENLGNTVIIGGGNVAMDASRAVLKMGATSSSILYRRDQEHMPARDIELEEAMEEGVKKVFLTRVIDAEGEGRKINKVHCIKTQIIDHKAQDIEGAYFDYDCDSVVFAIGLKPNKDLLENMGIELDWSTIKVDEMGRTSVEKIYAGGDDVDTSTVCWAVAMAKKAAKAIMEDLQ